MSANENINVRKQIAYTWQQAKLYVQEELPNFPDTVVFHVGTNDIKNNIPLDTIMETVNVTVRMISSKSKKSHVLISGVVVRGDDAQFDVMRQELNFQLLKCVYKTKISHW